MQHFIVYFIGLCLVVAGLAYGAHLLGIDRQWIGVGVVIVVGIGLMTGALRGRSHGRH